MLLAYLLPLKVVLVIYSLLNMAAENGGVPEAEVVQNRQIISTKKGFWGSWNPQSSSTKIIEDKKCTHELHIKLIDASLFSVPVLFDFCQ